MARPRRTDVEVMREVAAGGREALGELYDRFSPRMLALGQRMLGSRREAEDLVHDVFLEAWRRAQSYDPARASVSTWLLLRARSRALDRLRTSRKGQAIEREAALFAAGQLQPDAATIRDGRAVRAILTELPVDQRAVLELGFFAGYSYAEIAARLAIPVGTVKSRMARALERMRAQLHAYEARS
jgi:RNA polymerase sigma-70 factor, ECF subfamily